MLVIQRSLEDREVVGPCVGVYVRLVLALGAQKPRPDAESNHNHQADEY